MSRPTGKETARRLKRATARVECQPYHFVGPRRTPRLGGSPTFCLFCWPTTAIAAGGTLAGQEIKKRQGGLYQISDANGTLFNPMSVAAVANKTTIVIMNEDGTYTAITQSC